MKTQIESNLRDPSAEELLTLTNRIIYDLTRSQELKKDLPGILKDLYQGLRADLAWWPFFQRRAQGSLRPLR